MAVALRLFSGDLTCEASNNHFVIVEMASEVSQLDDEAIARVLRLKALAAAALGVVVDISAPTAARAEEGVVDEARRDFASAYLRGETMPRGYATRDYPIAYGALDIARIAVSFEREEKTVAVSGAQ